MIANKGSVNKSNLFSDSSQSINRLRSGSGNSPNKNNCKQGVNALSMFVRKGRHKIENYDIPEQISSFEEDS
jgi:hypothetical protein